MPDVYPAILREVVVLKILVQQPPAPSTQIRHYTLIAPTPPSDLSNLGITNTTTICKANSSPKPSPSYTPLTEPTPTSPDLLGTISIGVTVRKSP